MPLLTVKAILYLHVPKNIFLSNAMQISHIRHFYIRNAIDGLKRRTENSKWWATENGIGKYDAEAFGQTKWLENAIKVYAKALKALW